MTSPKKDSSNNSTLVLEPPMTTPRGSHTILAQQINQEIIELRNIYDDHREEMLSLISDQQQTKKLTASAGNIFDILLHTVWTVNDVKKNRR